MFVKWSSLPTRAAAELMLAEHVRSVLVPACARVGIACEFWGWRHSLDLHFADQRDGKENGGAGANASGATSAGGSKGETAAKNKDNEGPVCFTLIFGQKTGRLLDDIEDSLIGLDEDSARKILIFAEVLD